MNPRRGCDDVVALVGVASKAVIDGYARPADTGNSFGLRKEAGLISRSEPAAMHKDDSRCGLAGLSWQEGIHHLRWIRSVMNIWNFLYASHC